MKHGTWVALAAGLSLAAAAMAGEAPKGETKSAAAPGVLAIGAGAPMTDVKMQNVDGKNLAIGDVKGEKGTLVVFTCNHCPWAQAWESRIIALGNEYSKKGIGVMLVNSNDPTAYEEDAYEVMQTRAKERGMEFPYVVDATSDVARAFGASHTPEAFLFGKTGKLVYHGAVDDNAKQPDQVTARWLQDALAATAAGKPVAVKETKSMGCSIKYRAKAGSSSS